MADAATQTNLLQKAEDNTKLMLYTLLKALGIAHVNIIFES